MSFLSLIPDADSLSALLPQCLVLGAGPCGLRTAIELSLLGAQVVVLEKREDFTRNNVLHLWPFTIYDLRELGAKKFYGKFCSGALDHISEWLLLKIWQELSQDLHPACLIGFSDVEQLNIWRYLLCLHCWAAASQLCLWSQSIFCLLYRDDENVPKYRLLCDSCVQRSCLFLITKNFFNPVKKGGGRAGRMPFFHFDNIKIMRGKCKAVDLHHDVTELGWSC